MSHTSAPDDTERVFAVGKRQTAPAAAAVRSNRQRRAADIVAVGIVPAVAAGIPASARRIPLDPALDPLGPAGYRLPCSAIRRQG